jgi:hypothetical protein
VDVGKSATWNRLFLTFDVDWAHDEVLRDTIELIQPYDLPVTWFITHETDVLAILRSEQHRWDLGIHPNFNRLLDGSEQGTAAETLGNLLKIVPGATSVRSHSLVQSSLLYQLFLKFGLTHDSNDYVPSYSGLELKPFCLENGLVKVPYCFSDELWCVKGGDAEDFKALLNSNGMLVFDFHPIHVFLNTESLDRYEKTRHLHRKPKELIKHRYEGYGTRNRLIELLKLARKPSK